MKITKEFMNSIFDQVNFRLKTELSDWLTETVRKTKHLHGSKICKEQILMELVSFLRDLNLNWSEIKDTKILKKILKERIK